MKNTMQTYSSHKINVVYCCHTAIMDNFHTLTTVYNGLVENTREHLL
jgi:hypothetical protein